MIYVVASCDCCRKEHPLAAASINRGKSEIAQSWVFASVDMGKAHQDHLFCESCASLLGLLLQCPGEAHSTPYIDHCGICAPRWGLVLANPLPALCWDDVVNVFNKIQVVRLEMLFEEPDSDDGTFEHGYGNIYPTEEEYLLHNLHSDFHGGSRR